MRFSGHPDAPRLAARRTWGQAVVEFGIIVSVVLLLLMVAVDFGRVFFTYIQLNNTAREGAAYAAANPFTDNATLTTIANRETNRQAQRGESAITAVATCVDSSGTSIACTNASGGTGPGNRVTVSVGETFNFLTPLIGNFWPGGLRVAASSTAAVYGFAAGGGGTPPAQCTTPPPPPTFTWQSPDPVNRPTFISVDAGSSPNLPSPCQVVGYNWEFGGASTDPGGDDLREGITQDYEYAAGGTYLVTLTVQNAAGEASTTNSISVGTTACSPPTASFTVSPALVVDKKGTNWKAANNGGQQATMFNFDGSASAFMSDPACHPAWSWDLGDNTIILPPSATATPPPHGYAHAYAGTTVHVTLTVTNDAGTSSHVEDLPLE